MFCDNCLNEIAKNKLDSLDIAILKALYNFNASTLSRSKTMSLVTAKIREVNPDLKVTTAFITRSIMILQLLELIVISSGKPQKYYISDTGIALLRKLKLINE